MSEFEAINPLVASAIPFKKQFGLFFSVTAASDTEKRLVCFISDPIAPGSSVN